MKRIYMAVTADEYELPIYVSDFAAEMARFVGQTVANLYSIVSRGTVTLQGYKVVRVIIPETEAEEEYFDREARING